MKYPNWKEFESKYPNSKELAFEALARMLFRNRYELMDSLPYFKNHAGNETETIVDKGVEIGFQAKYFDKEINADKIEHSIETAHINNPTQKVMIIYTNLEFGNPRRKGEKKTEKQKNIEKVASDCGILLEWMYGDNILDAVLKNEMAYNVFFNTESFLQYLPQDVVDYNESQLSYIHTELAVKRNNYKFDKHLEIIDLGDAISSKKNVMISGESGCGKSAIIKEYYDQNKMNLDFVFFIINAGQLDTQELNSLFSLKHNYTLSEFTSYYKEVNNKVLVIDSAEQMLDLYNRRTALMLVYELRKENWTFIVTCKSNVRDDMLNMLKNDFQLDFVDVTVGRLVESELNQFVNTTGIQLPIDDKLREQLSIPFYLARYCEVGGTEKDIQEFRNKVWKHKVRGTSVIGRKNESCLFEIVRRKQANGVYLVTTVGLDPECIECLIKEDIIGEKAYQGIFIKHDIYTDWALDYMLTTKLVDRREVEILLNTKSSRSYVNAFRRWLKSKVDTSDAIVKSILTVMFEGKIDERWVQTILEVIGSSCNYSTIFINEYFNLLKENDYYWFNMFAQTVSVSCRTVLQYIPYKDGIRIPITIPIGSGWKASISFINDIKDEYYISNLSVVYNILNGYSNKRNKDREIARIAGLLALRIFNIQANSTEGNLYFFHNDMKDWAALVCKYALYINIELNKILIEVVNNNWTLYDSPYYELIDYLLISQNIIVDINALYVCRINLLAILKLFWCESKHDGDVYSNIGAEREFGINTQFGGKYFPSSPFQTPILGLLNTESLTSINDMATLNFVISFVDNCVSCFECRGRRFESLEKVIVFFADETEHEVWCSYMLWNIYRGTNSTTVPNLLKSIHMALEKYLLDQLEGEKKSENKEKIESMLWHILKNSHSASLYSIVTSVVLAHYDDLFDLLLFLLQNMMFLKLDLHRQISERSAMSMSFVYWRHKDYAIERKNSADMKHRQLHLELLLTNLQIKYENSNIKEDINKLHKLYACVDKLENDLMLLPKGKVSDESYIMARVNVRKYQKKSIITDSGVEILAYEPVLSDDLIKAREESEKVSWDIMLGMNIIVWAEKMLKGDIQGAKIYDFHDKPNILLDIIKKSEHVSNESSECFGKEFVPYVGSAALLIYYRDKLTKNETTSCSQKVFDALLNPDFISSSMMTVFDILIEAIPVLIELNPDKEDLIADILLLYAKRREERGNFRSCDKIHALIFKHRMWNTRKDFMTFVVKRFKDSLMLNKIEEITMNDAETLLCILTKQPEDRELANICIKKLSGLWNVTDGRFNDFSNKAKGMGIIASYLMYSPDNEIPELTSIFGECMAKRQYNETLLSELLIVCICNNRYDKFWKIWYALFPSLVKSTILLDSNSKMDYMLCPWSFQQSSNDWFKFEKKDVDFFMKIVEKVGCDNDVLFCILRVFNTIGSKYQFDAIHIIYQLTREPLSDLSNLKNYILEELNIYIDSLINKHRSLIISNNELYKYYCEILEFARNNNSEIADHILKSL